MVQLEYHQTRRPSIVLTFPRLRACPHETAINRSSYNHPVGLIAQTTSQTMVQPLAEL